MPDGLPTDSEKYAADKANRLKAARLKSKRAEDARKAARREAALSKSTKDPHASLKADAFSTQSKLIKNPALKQAITRTHRKLEHKPTYLTEMQLKVGGASGGSRQNGSYFEPDEEEKLRNHALEERVAAQIAQNNQRKLHRVRGNNRVDKKLRFAKTEALRRMKSCFGSLEDELDGWEDVDNVGGMEDWEDVEDLDNLDDVQVKQVQFSREVEKKK